MLMLAWDIQRGVSGPPELLVYKGEAFLRKILGAKVNYGVGL